MRGYPVADTMLCWGGAGGGLDTEILPPKQSEKNMIIMLLKMIGSSPTPKPETPDPETETRNPKPKIRNPKPETLNPKHENRNPKPETRNPKPEILNPKA